MTNARTNTRTMCTNLCQKPLLKYKKKSRIWEILNLSMFADSRTDTKTDKNRIIVLYSCVTCQVSNDTCHVSCVICRMSHFTCHLSPVTNANSQSHRPSPCYLPHCPYVVCLRHHGKPVRLETSG